MKYEAGHVFELKSHTDGKLVAGRFENNREMIYCDHHESPIAEVLSHNKHDLQRLVDCWNALRGIDDPFEFVRKAKGDAA